MNKLTCETGMTKEQLLKLPLEQQKVEIAKDVLALLHTRKIQARNGKYLFTYHVNFENALISIDEGGEYEDALLIDRLRRLWKEAEEGYAQECGVCAIGSLFVGALDTFNSLKLSDIEEDVPTDKHMIEYLLPWWDEYELRLMEFAFEGAWQGEDDMMFDGEDDGDRGEWKDEVTRAYEIYQNYKGGEEGMRAILNNIISNGGSFKP